MRFKGGWTAAQPPFLVVDALGCLTQPRELGRGVQGIDGPSLASTASKRNPLRAGEIQRDAL